MASDRVYTKTCKEKPREYWFLHINNSARTCSVCKWQAKKKKTLFPPRARSTEIQMDQRCTFINNINEDYGNTMKYVLCVRVRANYQPVTLHKNMKTLPLSQQPIRQWVKDEKRCSLSFRQFLLKCSCVCVCV